jgi:ATP-dependent exoDNAse (exonuclease V) alpha subunit
MNKMQLPAIQCNASVQELLNKPNFLLSEVLRQAKENPILRLATAIREGTEDFRSMFEKGLKDSRYFDATGKVLFVSEDDIYRKNAEIQRSTFQKNFDNNYCNITYTNRNRARLNQLFRAALYDFGPQDPPIVGEKIVCRKNNYKTVLDNYILRKMLNKEQDILSMLSNSKYPLLEELMETFIHQGNTDEESFFRNSALFNGTSGKILGISPITKQTVKLFVPSTKTWVSEQVQACTMDFAPDAYGMLEFFEDVNVCIENLLDSDADPAKLPYYGRPYLNFFNYGYCITGHASQGSEYDKVAIWKDIPRMNPKELKEIIPRWFYTAITRAKKKLILLG